MAIVREMKLRICSTVTDLTDAGLPAGEDDVTEVNATGYQKEADGVFSFSYQENTENGKIFSDVTVGADSVTVVRHGAIESEIVFKEGETTATVYRIPPYSFDMTVQTAKIRNGVTKDGGRLDLIYSMVVGGAPKKVRFRLDAERV